MPTFTMPSLGADMDEGTLLEWLVRPGDRVHKGDVVAVVDTAKAAVEVETFSEGVVQELLVEPGTTVPVGAPLAVIGDREGAVVPAAAPVAAAVPSTPSGSSPVHSPLVRREAKALGVDLEHVVGTGPGGSVTRDDVTRAAAEAAPPASPAPVPPAATPPPGAAPAAPAGRRPRVTPYARRLAAELGVDLAAVVPTADGTVHAQDVRAAASAASVTPPREPATAPAPAREERAPVTSHARDRMRSTIAAAMSRSKREIPHYYLTTTVDLHAGLGWMQERNRELEVGERLVPAALMLKATALAARAVPELNGYWVDDAFRPGDGVNLGVAVSLRGGGMVAPVLHEADRMPVTELMVAMRDLVTRARAGRLRDRELRDATITVTNLGDRGVEAVYGVIHPPQVAVVGFGRVLERPWAVDGMLAVRPVTTLTLSADHRATDGFVGSRFLNALEERLQHPEEP